jgi:hypothetical protein
MTKGEIYEIKNISTDDFYVLFINDIGVIVSKIVNDYYYSKHPFDNYFEIVH